ncbi:hypothetical protein [Salinibacter grassmerensis]|uniref:hypothetical protein n=1 Tax=Salinibacter grassmerensis TaxID=3040353 RepID=UPI0021E7ACFB|nr:hypothetical protein [Salinibacter grassmerensis]
MELADMPPFLLFRASLLVRVYETLEDHFFRRFWLPPVRLGHGGIEFVVCLSQDTKESPPGLRSRSG